MDWLRPTGRVSRSTYWLQYLLPLGVPMVLVAVYRPATLLLRVVWGAAFALWLIGATKRLHDLDRSGWVLVLLFPGGVGLVWLAGTFGRRLPPVHLLDDTVNAAGLVATVVVGAAWLLLGGYLALARGTEGPNKFGPAPRALSDSGPSL